MKKIEAIVEPSKVEEIKDALQEIGIGAIIATEVRGFGKLRERTELFRGSAYTVDYLPEVKIEIVVGDDRVNAAVTALFESAHAGEPIHGKIFASVVERAVSILSEDINECAALTGLPIPKP